MIYKIYANDKRFRGIEFNKGLNIILADREQTSGNKNTRNGAGKTTLINIIHFCLGSNPKRNTKLPLDKLEGWKFTIELDIFGKKIIASRSIDNPKIIEIKGDTTNFPISPIKNSEDNTLSYTNNEWKKLLGMSLFGLEDTGIKYYPSFRSLISYFIRRTPEAYNDPFKHFRNQQTWDWQVNNAFLLGLNWIHAIEAQHIRDNEKELKTLSKIIKGGFYPTLGELEANRIGLIKEINTEEKALSEFKVHPQYNNLQEKSNILTKTIHELSDQSITLQNKLDRYEESISIEHTPKEFALEELYKESGMIFPDNIKKTLKEAKNFHNTIIKNRKEFLQVEITEIKHKIYSTKKDLKLRTNERASIMQVLKTHGAFEEFIKLQEHLSKKKETLEFIKIKIDEINKLSEQKIKIKEKKIELNTKIKRDYEETRPYWESALVLFNENSYALYDQPGVLIINTSESGYKFEVEIQRSNSEGISKMKVFCYDLMLVELQFNQDKIDFLIHDSTIFDGVDPRQQALAIQLAYKKAIKNNFQYICTINSNMIQDDEFKSNLESGFDINRFIRLKLTDKDPSGSTLGFEF